MRHRRDRPSGLVLGNLIDDSTAEAARWASAYVAAGPSEPVDVPVNWSFTAAQAPSEAPG